MMGLERARIENWAAICECHEQYQRMAGGGHHEADTKNIDMTKCRYSREQARCRYGRWPQSIDPLTSGTTIEENTHADGPSCKI